MKNIESIEKEILCKKNERSDLFFKISECSGLFKHKKRKELEIKVEQVNKEISNLEVELEGIKYKRKD